MEKELLTKDNIVLNANLEDKEQGIILSGQILVDQGYVKPGYIDDMLERERNFGVYIGNHVAIPHGLLESESKILKSGISVIQVPEGVAFGENTAYVLIGIAGKGDQHINILQKIAMVCMDIENVKEIKNAKSEEEIIRLLTQ